MPFARTKFYVDLLYMTLVVFDSKIADTRHFHAIPDNIQTMVITTIQMPRFTAIQNSRHTVRFNQMERRHLISIVTSN